MTEELKSKLVIMAHQIESHCVSFRDAVARGDEDAVRKLGKEISVPLAHNLINALPEDPNERPASRNWG